MATATLNYGAYTAMTVTNLQSLAEDHADPFAGWQSDMVDNKTTVKATDYEIFVKLTTANTAPANEKAAYVYVCPFTNDDSSGWNPSDQGTATLPTGAEGVSSITIPNSLKFLGRLAYSTQNMTMQGMWDLSTIMPVMPDGFSIIIINNTGAALATGCIVAYRPITIAIA